jgi:repressor LexA
MTENTTKQLKRDTGDIMTGGYRYDECFALKVTDDGFLPSILPDDIVIIHRQPDVENGELAAIMIDGDTNAILRRVRHNEDGGITLTADNAKPTKYKRYDPIVIGGDELYRVHCFGKVVSLMRDMQGDAGRRAWTNTETAEDVGE